MEQNWLKYYDKGGLKYKIPNITIYDQIANSATKYPDNIAIEFLEEQITFKELLKSIDKTAIAFHKLGMKKGDIITIALPNIPEVLICFYAINKLGGICNMVHPLSSNNDLNNTLDVTKSKYIITLSNIYEKIKDNSNLEKIMIVDSTKLDYLNDNKIIFFKQYIDTTNLEEIKIEKLGCEDVAVILHSGGTSGVPKHVLIQNKAFINISIGHNFVLKNMTPGTSYLAVLPNFHGFGLNNCMTSPLANGCKVILVPQFDAKTFDILVDKTKPNTIIGVPTMFETLINCQNIKNLDLSFTKYWISGGDNLSFMLENKINNYLKEHNSNAKIIQGYGLTETLSCICGCSDIVYKKGSIGIMFLGMDAKVIDSVTDKEVEPGEIGELITSGNSLMLKYFDNEEETNKILKKRNGVTWLYTGDLVTKDKDGFIFYKGRIKRMFISSGYNVYPSYIETVLKQHPDVLDCSVVDIEHKYKQKVGIAFVILNNYNENIKEELIDYCKNNLPHYMIPHDLIFKDSFPKTKIGKTDYQKLQKEVSKI